LEYDHQQKIKKVYSISIIKIISYLLKFYIYIYIYIFYFILFYFIQSVLYIHISTIYFILFYFFFIGKAKDYLLELEFLLLNFFKYCFYFF